MLIATKDWQELAVGDGDIVLSFGVQAFGAIDLAVTTSSAEDLNLVEDFNDYIKLSGSQAMFYGNLNSGDRALVRRGASAGKDVVVRGYLAGNAVGEVK